MLRRVTAERTLRPPRSRGVGYVSIAAGVLTMLGLLVLIASREGGWTMSPLLALSLFLVIHGGLTLATRVVVTSHGVEVVDVRRPRGLSMAWDDIESVRVDPPGGSRRVHLRRREGAEVSLPALSDADDDAVVAACRARHGSGRA